MLLIAKLTWLLLGDEVFESRMMRQQLFVINLACAVYVTASNYQCLDECFFVERVRHTPVFPALVQ